MTIVDHRVLVNAPPDIIWELLGDLTATPKWHINCSQASILTTQQEGVGVRCRLNMESGPDIVQEILSWYRNLGYEYTVVDGPYKTSRGRVRLQAIPEGTVVQWTLEYELSGFAAGMRDLTIRRRVNNEIEDSLKRLKKLVESVGIRMDTDTRDRVSMRPAPTAKERAVLAENIARTQPAMPPVNNAQPSDETAAEHAAAPVIDEGDLPPVPEPLVIDEGDLPPALDATAPEETDVVAISEPPVADEDTRPNPTIADDDATLPSRPDTDTVAASEPDETVAETVAIPAVNAVETIEAEPVEAPSESVDEAETVPEAQEPVQAAETMVAVPPVGASHEPIPEPDTPPADAVDSVEEDHVEPTVAEEPPQVAPVEPEPAPLPAMPTKSVFEEELNPMGPSIWEVFGMSAPSEADETEAPTTATSSLPPVTAEVTPADLLLRPRQRKNAHPGLSRTLQRRARTR